MEETRAQIEAKIQEIYEGDALLPFIPPENYSPDAAMVMLKILDAHVSEESQEFNPDIHFDLEDLGVVLASNILVLLNEGGQPRNDEEFIDAIWGDCPVRTTNLARRQAMVEKMQNILCGPPCKKKGGSKRKQHKNNQKKNKSKKKKKKTRNQKKSFI
jgi:hypothetical protein